MARLEAIETKQIELALEIQVKMQAILENEQYPIEVRREAGQVTKCAWALQALLSGRNCGDVWVEHFIDYMLGGYHGGEF